MRWRTSNSRGLNGLVSALRRVRSADTKPLSPRELEVLHLMVQGLSNQEMSERLFLALVLLKGTIGISLASSKSKGAPKRSHVPASWVCCSLTPPTLLASIQWAG